MAGAGRGTTKRDQTAERTHRLLFTVEGPNPGQTRKVVSAIAHDAVHVFAVEPASAELADVRRLAERAGATFTVDPVPADDLDAAFRAMTAALAKEPRSQRTFQVNAGADANVLSSAALLACLHEGVEAIFVHEKGKTPLPVLTPAPLRDLLTERERFALSAFPEAGVAVSDVARHDTAALNGLKKRALVALQGDRLSLTAQGRAFREHVGR